MSLIEYVTAQCSHVVPDGRESALRSAVNAHIDDALARMHFCINACASWRADQFNVMQSSQHSIFLYFLSNSIFKTSGNVDAATRLFLVNKAFNGIDLFYEIAMPPIFYIGHTVGIVLAKANYGNRLVLYQNVTIGRHKDRSPLIGDGVVVYPNSAIIGDCKIGDGAVVSQGTSVLDCDIARDRLAFKGSDGRLSFRDAPKNILDEYFRKSR